LGSRKVKSSKQLFQLVSEFKPSGDQPKAIEQMVSHCKQGLKHQVLLGVTGAGKTCSMAHTIAQLNEPALILAPNKTLAAQLYTEFRDLFPKNAVEYLIGRLTSVIDERQLKVLIDYERGKNG
jgi:excinuclease ABC subunit B